MGRSLDKVYLEKQREYDPYRARELKSERQRREEDKRWRQECKEREYERWVHGD